MVWSWLRASWLRAWLLCVALQVRPLSRTQVSWAELEDTLVPFSPGKSPTPHLCWAGDFCVPRIQELQGIACRCLFLPMATAWVLTSQWSLTLWTWYFSGRSPAWICLRDADPEFLLFSAFPWPGILPLPSLDVGEIMG